MELVLEIIGSEQFISCMPASKAFRRAGGIIGRSEVCDWVIPDRKRVVSGRHAQVSFEDGGFYLTDISSNGILLKPGNTPLPKGQPQRIEHGSLYSLGDFDLRARIVQDPAVFSDDLGRAQDAGSIIPDDAFLDLDPLNALDQQQAMYAAGDDLAMTSRLPLAETAHTADCAVINRDYLPVPELVAAPEPAAPAAPPAPAPAGQSEAFWQRFGDALGVNLEDLDEAQRQALAFKAARLLKQAVASVQQGLRNRNELKNDMQLAVTGIEQASNNPLKSGADSRQALSSLLRPRATEMPAEQAINRAFRDLQAHQVALLAASRAAVKSIFEQLSPEQLTLRFERENKSLINTAGSRWRAYSHLYQSLRGDDNWSQRLYARDFVVAYEEQVRLIATLNTDHQG